MAGENNPPTLVLWSMRASAQPNRTNSNRYLALAVVTLLAPIALAAKWSGNSLNLTAYGEQSGACGYYTNSSGHQVKRPCRDWRTNQGETPTGGNRALRGWHL
jgi:hypothetical protein